MSDCKMYSELMLIKIANAVLELPTKLPQIKVTPEAYKPHTAELMNFRQCLIWIRACVIQSGNGTVWIGKFLVGIGRGLIQLEDSLS